MYAFDNGNTLQSKITMAMSPGTFVNTGASIRTVMPMVRKDMISKYEPKKGTIRLVNGSVIKGNPV